MLNSYSGLKLDNIYLNLSAVIIIVGHTNGWGWGAGGLSVGGGCHWGMGYLSECGSVELTYL